MKHVKLQEENNSNMYYTQELKQEEWHTFDEWIKLGRIVVARQRASRRNSEGECIFEKAQTTDPELYLGFDYRSFGEHNNSPCQSDPFFNKTLHEDHYKENNFTGYSG